MQFALDGAIWPWNWWGEGWIVSLSRREPTKMIGGTKVPTGELRARKEVARLVLETAPSLPTDDESVIQSINTLTKQLRSRRTADRLINSHFNLYSEYDRYLAESELD